MTVNFVNLNNTIHAKENMIAVLDRINLIVTEADVRAGEVTFSVLCMTRQAQQSKRDRCPAPFGTAIALSSRFINAEFYIWEGY